jgi:hypothetical protein
MGPKHRFNEEGQELGDKAQKAPQEVQDEVSQRRPQPRGKLSLVPIDEESESASDTGESAPGAE